MDYSQLAEQFLTHGYENFRNGPQRRIDDSMRGENFVLIYLWQKQSCTLPSDLSAVMGVSTARIATALNGLEAKGLITRSIDTNDRRRILVDLTPAGRELAQQMRQGVLRHTALMFELLGEHDATEFVRIWGRLQEIAPKMNT